MLLGFACVVRLAAKLNASWVRSGRVNCLSYEIYRTAKYALLHMRRLSAQAKAALAKGGFVPQPVNSTADLCCGLREGPVLPLRGGTYFLAHAAFPSLRAHAAGKSNSQSGLFQ